MTLTYTAAFLGGLLSLFAPCGAMLLPAFFSYSFAERSLLLQRTVVFAAGMLTVLVPLGFAIGTVGSFIFTYRTVLNTTIGILIIVAGIVTALAIPLPHLHMPGFLKRKQTQGATIGQRDRSSSLAIYVLGISYGCAGVGCSGPILGAIIGLSATAASPLSGAVTMTAYAFGMVLPIFFLAILWHTLNIKRWWKPRPITFLGRYTTIGSLISGTVFIVLGIILVYTRGSLSFSLISGNTQINLESRIIATFAAVPNFLFVLIALLFIAVIAILISSASKKTNND